MESSSRDMIRFEFTISSSHHIFPCVENIKSYLTNYLSIVDRLEFIISSTHHIFPCVENIISYLTNYLSQVDRLEDELISEQEKFKAINEELEQTFAEMSGY